MAYIDPTDRQIASTRMAVNGRYEPCTREQVVSGEVVIATLPTDQCVYMEPARVWNGSWLNEYERSVFWPAEASQKAGDEPYFAIWLTGGPMEGEVGQTYTVSFVGRKTRYSGGYGHLGSYADEIIVDRVISIEPISQTED